MKDCPRAGKPFLIAFVMDLFADAYNLPPNDLFDIIQYLPDSVWYSLPSKIRISNDVEELGTDRADAVEDDSIGKPSQIMYSAIASWSEEHLFDRKPVQIFNVSSSGSIIFDFPFLDLSKIDIGEILKIPFDGIMTDNEASKNPPGFPFYLRYCAHTGHKSTIKPVSRCFAGIGNGIISSSALARFRMPLTPHLFLESSELNWPRCTLDVWVRQIFQVQMQYRRVKYDFYTSSFGSYNFFASKERPFAHRVAKHEIIIHSF